MLPAGPRLLALAVTKFHKTDSVLDTVRSHNIASFMVMVPAGCTSLVQPLDVAVNKPVKELLKELIEQKLDHLRKLVARIFEKALWPVLWKTGAC